jgi:hypothetical protein
MGHIVVYNMNLAAALTVKVRWGVEMRVDPTSILAPALKPSAHHDTLALIAYSDIAGNLPWAYPSAYNADNKIVDVIKRVWNSLRPVVGGVLRMIPHPVSQAIGGAISNLPDFERPAGTSNVVVSNKPTGNGRKKRPATKAKRNITVTTRR